VGLQLQAVFEPGGHHGVDEVVHHVAAVVWGGGDAQEFLAPRHGREVDGLDVDAVFVHQGVGQLHHQHRISNLGQRARSVWGGVCHNCVCVCECVSKNCCTLYVCVRVTCMRTIVSAHVNVTLASVSRGDVHVTLAYFGRRGCMCA